MIFILSLSPKAQIKKIVHSLVQKLLICDGLVQGCILFPDLDFFSTAPFLPSDFFPQLQIFILRPTLLKNKFLIRFEPFQKQNSLFPPFFQKNIFLW